MLNTKQMKAKKKALEYFGGNPVGNSFAAGSSAASGGLFPGNVVGVGVGARSPDGAGPAGEILVRVYVTTKTSKLKIPDCFDDFPTEVLEVGDVVATALLSTGQRFGRHRPASCGVSVGHPNVTAGTLGCRVEKNGKHYILSNNHVLANCNLAKFSDAIVQPGTLDGGKSPTDNIATLEKYMKIKFSGPANDYDAAIADLIKSSDLESDIIDIGPPGKTPPAVALYQSVRKHGRTTGHTVGVVVDLSVSLWVGYGVRRAWFQDQVAIQGVGASHFSAGGDSGSLIVDAVTLDPVALLFAGSTSGLTFGNPIAPVLSRYGVVIA